MKKTVFVPNNHTEEQSGLKAVFVAGVKQYILRYIEAFIVLLLLGKLFTGIIVERGSNRSLDFRGTLWVLPALFLASLIYCPVKKMWKKDPVSLVREKLEIGVLPVRVIYRNRFAILILQPLCCWITRGVIASCGIILGKKTFDVRRFATRIDYSYLFDKKYIPIYVVGALIISLMIGFVIRSTGILLESGVKKILKRVGIKSDRMNVDAQFRIIMTVLACAVFSVGIIISISTMWLFKTWANLNIYELVYTATSPIKGTNPEMVRDYILKYASVELAVIIVVVVAFVLLRKRTKVSCGMRIAVACLGVILITGSFVYADKRLGIIKYIKNLNGDASFAKDTYINPKSVKIKFPEKKRNLIYIYLESFEMTYADEEAGGAFYNNVIPKLTGLAQEGETFSGDPTVLNGGISLDGTTWTIGAIFGQSSGVPMLINMSSSAFETQDSFCEGITTIGDILEENGYRNIYMIGSDAGFGGRDTFYRTHGDYEIYDYDYAIESGWIPSDYEVWWGYEDEKLFTFAKNTLQELAAGDQPFNLTLLTVDTHFEDGYVCELCGDEFGYNQYANVFHCSDRQVYEFVKWIMAQEWYEDTVVILCGDHPTMDSDFCDAVDESYQRRVYTNFINSSVEYKGGERMYTTLDMFPTTLAAMGVAIEGDRLAWGTNLYSDRSTYAEMYGKTVLNENLQQGKKFIEELANFEVTEELLDKVRERFEFDRSTLEEGVVKLTVNIDEMIHGSFVDGYELEYTEGGENKVINSVLTETDDEPVHSFVIEESEVVDLKNAKLFIVVGGKRYFVTDIDNLAEVVR